MRAQTSSAEMDNGSTLEQGLIGHWTFDGKDTPWSSATKVTAIDRSGNGNNATSTTMTRAGSPTIGKLGQALNFNGSVSSSATNNGFPSGNHPVCDSGMGVLRCRQIRPLR